jgi:hypothetical protein
MQEPPLEKVRDRQGQALGGGTVAIGRVMASPTGKGHAVAIAGH